MGGVNLGDRKGYRVGGVDRFVFEDPVGGGFYSRVTGKEWGVDKYGGRLQVYLQH